MSKSKDLCNNTYRDLCATLGELQIQRSKLDSRIEAILAQIDLLNALAPRLEGLESILIKEVQDKQIEHLKQLSGIEEMGLS